MKQSTLTQKLEITQQAVAKLEKTASIDDDKGSDGAGFRRFTLVFPNPVPYGYAPDHPGGDVLPDA